MAQDIEVPEGRESARGVFVKLAAMGTSALATVLLAVWFGLTLGDDIRHGMPWNQLQPRAMMAAVMLIGAVVLIMCHRSPGLLAGKGAWWERVLFAAASVTWVMICQTAFGSLGA